MIWKHQPRKWILVPDKLQERINFLKVIKKWIKMIKGKEVWNPLILQTKMAKQIKQKKNLRLLHILISHQRRTYKSTSKDQTS